MRLPTVSVIHHMLIEHSLLVRHAQTRDHIGPYALMYTVELPRLLFLV